MLQVFHLENSRSQRIVWLLEELEIPYELHTFQRQGGVAGPDFKKACKSAMGKSPTVHYKGLVITESGAITNYIIRNYAPSFSPKSEADITAVDQWVQFSEGTLMTHLIAMLYPRWHLPKMPHSPDTLLDDLVQRLTPNVHNDLDAVEQALEGSDYLVGSRLTAADIMMAFSVDFCFTKQLGTKGLDIATRWPRVWSWLNALKARQSWKDAQEKTGDDLNRQV